jgi:hypothetical protein
MWNNARANDEAKPINTVDVIVRFKGIEDATTLLFAFIVICKFRDLCIYFDSILCTSDSPPHCLICARLWCVNG